MTTEWEVQVEIALRKPGRVRYQKHVSIPTDSIEDARNRYDAILKAIGEQTLKRNSEPIKGQL